MKPEEMTPEQLKELIKECASVYIENVNIIASTPIRMPEEVFNQLMEYSKN